MTEAGYQKLTLLAVSFLVAFGMWMGKAWLAGPETIAERDEAQAKKERDAMRESGRVRVVSARPEWLRRVQRKWLAVGRLGERKLQRSE